MFKSILFSVLSMILAAVFAQAQESHRVLIVVNDNSSVSRSIGDYYAQRRGVPQNNICHIRASEEEDIARDQYNRLVAAPIAQCLRARGLVESIYYIVTTLGDPLRIPGNGDGMENDAASVDSELALLYLDMKRGTPHALRGSIPNPFFGKKDAPFTHPQFPMYMVTRLAAYDFDGVKAIIDRSLQAANKGKFVIDEANKIANGGDQWLQDAAVFLPKDRVVLDETPNVIYDVADVIGYASWGSNDTNRNRRFTGFHFLPGAIVTEFVSSDARTFKKPPDSWVPGHDWNNSAVWFAGTPQSMSADYLFEGATGVSGHVYEPYLIQNPRPDLLLPAYYHGRNLADSYYLSIRSLSWMNVVVGDPLCSLGKP